MIHKKTVAEKLVKKFWRKKSRKPDDFNFLLILQCSKSRTILFILNTTKHTTS